MDPTYDTHSGTGTYVYVDRLSASDVGAHFAAFATTGQITRPLITVAGTMDDVHARAYARRVAGAQGRDDSKERRQEYRLYEVQNGNHIETFKTTFPQLQFI